MENNQKDNISDLASGLSSTTAADSNQSSDEPAVGDDQVIAIDNTVVSLNDKPDNINK